MALFVRISTMLGLNIFIGIILFIMYVVMMSMMIIFERDKPKNMIIWSMVFLSTQIVGYAIYLVIRHVFYKKRNSIAEKEKEDQIYDHLIANNIYDNKTCLDHEVFNFNSLAFDSHITANNSYELFNDYSTMKENLIDDLNRAKKYIICELTGFNKNDFQDLKEILISKANDNIAVRLIYDRNIGLNLVKELRRAGVKVNRFSKHNTVGRVYSNLRNAITIDGEVVYLTSLNTSKKHLEQKQEVASMFIKIKGDIVQDIDIQTRKDAVFASGKFIPYEKQNKPEYRNSVYMQYVANNANTDLELALIKAICMAKKSIQLELAQFIPTESIMSLLRFAINSNIEVRLMVPLKNDRHGKYFASRAYAKELALFGANVYLFDGYITFNAITIDEEYVVFGSFIVDREHLNTSVQSMVFIKDNKAVKSFNAMFEAGIANIYRINDAKYMLMREKFFKNFV